MDIFAANDHEEAVWIYPDISNNQSLPEEQRAGLKIKPMTGKDYLRIEHSNLIKQRGMRSSEDSTATENKREWAKMRRVIKERTIELRNWFFVDKATGERRELTDAEDWVNAILASANVQHLAAVYQVYGTIVGVSGLTEEQAGESTSPSGSH
jgi:hypothetical protein